MTQKFLYIVDHYIPFPRSEYGGIWTVIAENDGECFNLITDEDVNSHYEKHYCTLTENIMKAYKFELLNDEESRVVTEFTT